MITFKHHLNLFFPYLFNVTFTKILTPVKVIQIYFFFVGKPLMKWKLYYFILYFKENQSNFICIFNFADSAAQKLG